MHSRDRVDLDDAVVPARTVAGTRLHAESAVRRQACAARVYEPQRADEFASSDAPRHTHVERMRELQEARRTAGAFEMLAITYELTGGPLIKARDLTFAYGPVEALRGYALEIERGERVAVMGASWSGKSTLLDAGRARSTSVMSGCHEVSATLSTATHHASADAWSVTNGFGIPTSPTRPRARPAQVCR